MSISICEINAAINCHDLATLAEVLSKIASYTGESDFGVKIKIPDLSVLEAERLEEKIKWIISNSPTVEGKVVSKKTTELAGTGEPSTAAQTSMLGREPVTRFMDAVDKLPGVESITLSTSQSSVTLTNDPEAKKLLEDLREIELWSRKFGGRILEYSDKEQVAEHRARLDEIGAALAQLSSIDWPPIESRIAKIYRAIDGLTFGDAAA